MADERRLSWEEITEIVRCLNDYPSWTPPDWCPPNKEMTSFDGRRIALTLADLLAMTDYQANYIGAYRAENQAQRDRIALLEAELRRRQP